MHLRTDDFDYDLPAELIAQEPAPNRTGSRLMVLQRADQSIEHAHFAEIVRWLRPGDLLVANRSRVIPARLSLRKSTGARVELLLIREVGAETWTALARPSRKLRTDMELRFDDASLRAHILEERGAGEWLVHFSGHADVSSELRKVGRLPLPPYIHNASTPDDRYQTVYGDRDGSIAAPTAGLHFSTDLLDRLRAHGVELRYVTLHVGIGTFKPVTVERILDHQMHPEWGEVPQSVADAVNDARNDGRRVIAVGTTTTRLLESSFKVDRVAPFRGETDQFIYPGYKFRAIDGLVTNFHLPRSTLLMLVSALAGREFVLHAYRAAVNQHYRFFSFGDAMLIV